MSVIISPSVPLFCPVHTPAPVVGNATVARGVDGDPGADAVAPLVAKTSRKIGACVFDTSAALPLPRRYTTRDEAGNVGDWARDTASAPKARARVRTDILARWLDA